METSGSAVQVMTVEEQIAYHLEYNLASPMHPKFIPNYVKVCMSAIKAIDEGDYDAKIDLYDGCYSRDGYTGEIVYWMWATEVIRNFSLYQWLDEEKLIEYNRRNR